jgi:prepilin peptidase CpaA
MPTMSNALTAAEANPTTAAPADDLGIDRAFVLQMAQVPFIAALFVLISYVAHLIWGAVASGTPDLAPVLIISVGMILAAVIDGWAFRVPNWLTLSLVLSGWALGLLHDLGVRVDAGQGGFLYSLAGTALGFALLFPILFIGGMGQGDVKMQMGFGAWLGAFFGPGHPAFGEHDALMILLYAFCAGVVVGGIFGLVMMVARRAFGSNVRNFREIFVDLQVLLTQGAKRAAERANARRGSWVRLPYGVPLCVGFLGTLAYLHWLA